MRSPQGKVRGWLLFAGVLMGAFAVLWVFQQQLPPPKPATPSPQTASPQPPKGFAKPALTEEQQAALDHDALAAALQEGKGCESIAFDAALRQKCADTLAYDAALKNEKEGGCDPLQDPALKADCQDRLATLLAFRAADLKRCDEVKNETLRQNCKDSILVSKGATATSETGCGAIVSPLLRQACLDQFHFATSVQALNAKGCEAILEGGLKSRCAETVAKNNEILALAKPQMAGLVASPQAARAGCETLGASAEKCKDETNDRLAAEKKDLTYCNDIGDAGLRQNCIDQVGVSINRYYLRLATAKKDPSLCAKVLDEGLRSACLAAATSFSP